MIKEYNNKQYYFDESASYYYFVRNPYLLPINIWKEVCIEIYDNWTDSLKNSILNNMLDVSNERSNYFLYDGKKYWLDKIQRSSILELLNSYSDNFSLILEDIIVPIEIDKAKEFLQDLNKYSYNCLVAYHTMKQNINNYENANFKYPEPLNLNDYLNNGN